MIKKIISTIIIVYSIAISAQQSTLSLYSFYGLGLDTFEGNVANASMGGVSMFSDVLNYSIDNPATYADLDLTSFGVGGSRTITNIKAEEGTSTGKITSFDYLTIAVPAGKFGFGLGLRPYKSRAYNIETENTNEILGDFTQKLEGSGNVNRAYFGIGGQVYKGLKVGGELQYNFGRLEEQITEYYESTFDTRYLYQSDISGLSYTLSALYDYNFNEDITFRGSLIYKASAEIKSFNSQERATITTSDGIDYVQNSETIDTDDNEFYLPSITTIGLSAHKKNKWFGAAQFYFGTNNDYQDVVYDKEGVAYGSSLGVKLGGFYIPKFNSLTNYFNRVIYRAGFSYDKTGLSIANQDIDDFGISFGMGLPMPRQFSYVDLGFKFGTRGVITETLVKENYFAMSIGLNLGQKWFRKRKFD